MLSFRIQWRILFFERSSGPSQILIITLMTNLHGIINNLHKIWPFRHVNKALLIDLFEGASRLILTMMGGE